MTTKPRESLERLLKKLKEAKDSNISISENPKLSQNGAFIYLLAAGVFQTSMTFIEEELELLEKETK